MIINVAAVNSANFSYRILSDGRVARQSPFNLNSKVLPHGCGLIVCSNNDGTVFLHWKDHPNGLHWVLERQTFVGDLQWLSDLTQQMF